VRRLPDVRRVDVVLEDHYTGDEINAAIARGEGFSGAFPGETDDDELRNLRELFTRKALIARQGAVCESLLQDGASAEDVLGRRVADLPDTPEARRCVELRRDLGIACEPESPAFVLPDGRSLAAGDFERWRRMARLVGTSLEANGGLCRSLLEFRHGLENSREEVAR
jgi:hypothetical protein